MGRYTSVQAYADNNANNRSVPYEQATGSAQVKTGGVKVEKVVNPYGSTAGAGSGEFHVYRHARSREMERLKQLDEMDEEQKKDLAFQQKLAEYKQEEEARTEKRRKKRQRQKESKLRRKNLLKAGVPLTGGNSSNEDDAEEDDDHQDFENDSKPKAVGDAPSPGKQDSNQNSTCEVTIKDPPTTIDAVAQSPRLPSEKDDSPS